MVIYYDSMRINFSIRNFDSINSITHIVPRIREYASDYDEEYHISVNYCQLFFDKACQSPPAVYNPVLLASR